MDAAGDAAAVVVGDVVLDDPEVRDAQGAHLGALPVLLEPAARVAVDGEVDDLEAPDAGLGDGEVLLECDVSHVGKAPIEDVGKPGAGVRPTAPVRGSGPGGLLWPAPPGLVGGVPVDRLLEPLGEVGVRRPPAELPLELGGVDGVAAVVAGRSATQSKSSGSFPIASRIMRRTVMLSLSPIGADEVGLPHPALGEDVPDNRGVVLGVDQSRTFSPFP